MALLTVIHEPDPRLRVVSKPIKEITQDIKQLALDMQETMIHEKGIGLAAPQVAVHLRMLVMQTEPSKRFYVMINPVILEKSSVEAFYKEGCLSIPAHYADVKRPESVVVSFLNLENKTETIAFKGLEAVCVQHEMDHLDGILFIDHLSFLKRKMILKKLSKATF